MVHNLNKDSQAMSRKERELALKKDTIFDAARVVFEKEGFFNTTMAQIAAKAEFGVGTLYQFFPSKQSLFVEVIKQELDEFMSSLKNLLVKKKSWKGERFDPELKSMMLLGIIHTITIAQTYFLGIPEKAPAEFTAGILDEFLGRLLP